MKRRMGSLITPRETRTDADGRFNFDFLPPDMEYAVYTVLNQEIPPVSPSRSSRHPGMASVQRFDDIATRPTQTLTLTVQAREPGELLADCQLYASQSQALHGAFFRLDSHGTDRTTVSIPGVAEEVVRIGVFAPEYRILRTAPQIPLANSRGFTLRTAETPDLTIVVVKEAE